MGVIVCFGEILIDLLVQLLVLVDILCVFLQYVGGVLVNVVVVVVWLGVKIQFVGMLGCDMFGDFLVDSLVLYGVGMDYIVCIDVVKIVLVFVVLDVSGECSFSFYCLLVVDLLFCDSDFQVVCFDSVQCFYVCFNSLIEVVIVEVIFVGMDCVCVVGVVVSFDFNLCLVLWLVNEDLILCLWQVLECVDLVKLLCEELDYLVVLLGVDGEVVVLWCLFVVCVCWVIVIDGVVMLYWYMCDNYGMVISFCVVIVDIMVVGDVFVGGVLVGLLECGGVGVGFVVFCQDLEVIIVMLCFGVVVGVLVVICKGVFVVMFLFDEVQQLLQVQDIIV